MRRPPAQVGGKLPVPLPAGSGEAGLLLAFERPLEERSRGLRLLPTTLLGRRRLVREELGPAEQASLLWCVACVMLAWNHYEGRFRPDVNHDSRLNSGTDRSSGVVHQQCLGVCRNLLGLGDNVLDLSGWLYGIEGRQRRAQNSSDSGDMRGNRRTLGTQATGLSPNIVISQRSVSLRIADLPKLSAKQPLL